jgi:hypothetical protein
MKQKSSKLAKLERSRFSIFTDDLDTCMFCGMSATDLNEIFRGRNRRNSMKYGAVQPLCRKCHSKITNNTELENKWKIKGQKRVMEYYKMSVEEFIDIFHRNYL